MAPSQLFIISQFLLIIPFVVAQTPTTIGVTYTTSPSTSDRVVRFIESVNISAVCLLGANPDVIRSFSSTNVSLLLTIPNSIVPGCISELHLLSSAAVCAVLFAPFVHRFNSSIGAPFTANGTLPLCGYSGAVCCSPKDDLQLQKQFQAMNASDSGYASVLKSILRAKCDKYSAELFTVSSTQRPVPVLCNSTVSAEASQSTQAAVDYCFNVWDSCQNASLVNSIFAPSLQGQAGLPASSNSTKLTDFWQSKADFCNAFNSGVVILLPRCFNS